MEKIFHSANYKLRSGQIDEAITDYKQAIKKNPSCFFYYQNLALAYAQKKEFIEAACNVRLALSYAPNISSLKALLEKYNKPQNETYSNPTLSIIVPVYNTKEYLPRCIESILAQGYKDFELIIVNDGSTDGSYGIIKKYASLDSRIILISNKNPSGNPGSPRNQALQIARGKYIGFVDSDDWIDANYYSCLMEKALKDSSDIVFSGGFKNHEADGFSIRKYNSSNFSKSDFKFYKYHESFMIWDKVFKREIIERFSIRLAETKAAVDVPFIFKAYFYSQKISYCNDLIGYNYRRETPTSVTANFRKKSSCDFEFSAYSNITKWATQEDIPSYFKNIIEIKKITSYIYTLGLINPDDFPDFFKKTKNELALIDRKLVECFAKELKKSWVLKKFDLILQSTPEEYFKSTRESEQNQKQTHQAKSKIYIEGSKPGIVFFPAWLQANPYQEMFYKSINAVHNLRVTGYAKEDFCEELIQQLKEKFEYIHFHWLHTFISGSDAETQKFISNIRHAKTLGYKIIYTAHNIVSHECSDTKQEIEIRKSLIKEFDIIIAHGKTAEQRLIHELNADPKKIKIIPHGTYCGYYDDSITKKDARKKLGLEENSFIYLFFGNIREYKGLNPLIDAFEKIQSTSPKARLLISGRARTKDLEQSICKKVSKNNNIIFHPGFVDNNNVQLYLKACDAFVLPYERVLTSGAALLALSFKKPIIAPQIGVLPEFINKELGELFCSYEEMRSIMESYYNSWESGIWSERYRESSFDNFLEMYKWNNLVQNISF